MSVGSNLKGVNMLPESSIRKCCSRVGSHPHGPNFRPPVADGQNIPLHRTDLEAHHLGVEPDFCSERCAGMDRGGEARLDGSDDFGAIAAYALYDRMSRDTEGGQA